MTVVPMSGPKRWEGRESHRIGENRACAVEPQTRSERNITPTACSVKHKNRDYDLPPGLKTDSITISS